MVELMHRQNWGIHVSLLWDRKNGKLRVVIEDTHTDSPNVVLQPETGKEALEMYQHPFSYA
jgi:hypothetical protein